jgi:2',3'-cyclic-nucleotide 2'-phosphodiesterase (5'-nucleotidase family)
VHLYRRRGVRLRAGYPLLSRQVSQWQSQATQSPRRHGCKRDAQARGAAFQRVRLVAVQHKGFSPGEDRSVYNIRQRSKDPVGGFPRFQTLVKSFSADNPLILFSGDALSPSALSIVTRGAHMVSVLNAVGTPGAGTTVASCLGNHDLDDGLDNFLVQSQSSRFSWLATNVSFVGDSLEPLAQPPSAGSISSTASISAQLNLASGLSDDDDATAPMPGGMARCVSSIGALPGEGVANEGHVIPGCERFLIVDHEGVKIGLIGLIEEDWLETLSHVDAEDLAYEDFVSSGRRWATRLREEMGCDMVIALTHMRLHNDLRLGRQAAEVGVDLVLGGHDHFYSTQEAPTGPAEAEPSGISALTRGEGPLPPVEGLRGSTLVAKSGTDFRQLTRIEMDVSLASDFGRGGPTRWSWERFDVTSSIEPDPEASALVEELSHAMKVAEKQIIGTIDTDMDGRFDAVRSRETNLGNFMADLARETARADCAVINGGTLRSDAIHPAGPFSLADLLRILPYPSEVPSVRVSGAALLEALEAAVSKWPEREGRFPQVSGIQMRVDTTKAPGSRIDTSALLIGTGALQRPWSPTERYVVATTDYLALGNDGYSALSPETDRGKELGNEWVVDLARAPVYPTVLRHRLETVQRVNDVQDSIDETRLQRWQARLLRLSGKKVRGSSHGSGGAPAALGRLGSAPIVSRPSLLEEQSLGMPLELEGGTRTARSLVSIAPVVEGRITLIE